MHISYAHKIYARIRSLLIILPARLNNLSTGAELAEIDSISKAILLNGKEELIQNCAALGIGSVSIKRSVLATYLNNFI